MKTEERLLKKTGREVENTSERESELETFVLEKVGQEK